MTAQLLLSFLLGAILIYAFAERRRSPVVGALALAAAVAGLYFVWVPAHATALAEFAGVGRGVDLIIYIWVVISLLVLLNLHLKLRAQTEALCLPYSCEPFPELSVALRFGNVLYRHVPSCGDRRQSRAAVSYRRSGSLRHFI